MLPQSRPDLQRHEHVHPGFVRCAVQVVDHIGDRPHHLLLHEAPAHAEVAQNGQGQSSLFLPVLSETVENATVGLSSREERARRSLQLADKVVA